MQSKSSYTYIELNTKGFYWRPPQSAVAALARGSHLWNANTALWVERFLFGLPCRGSTAGERELHTIANLRPLLCCQHCCFYTYRLSWLRTAVVGVPRVMQIYHWFSSFHEYNGLIFLLTAEFVQSNFRTGGCRRPFVQRLWATYYTRDKLEPPSEALPSLRRIQAWLIGDLSSRKWRRCFQRTRNLLRQAIITRFLTVSSKKNVLWGRPNVALFRVSSLLNSGIYI